MPTCTDICSFMNKAFTAKAVVVCDVKLHRAAENSLDLGEASFCTLHTPLQPPHPSHL